MRLRSRWHRRPVSHSLCVEHLEDRQLLSSAVRLLPTLLVEPVHEPAASAPALVRSEPVERQAPAPTAPAPPSQDQTTATSDSTTSNTSTPTATEQPARPSPRPTSTQPAPKPTANDTTAEPTQPASDTTVQSRPAVLRTTAVKPTAQPAADDSVSSAPTDGPVVVRREPRVVPVRCDGGIVVKLLPTAEPEPDQEVPGDTASWTPRTRNRMPTSKAASRRTSSTWRSSGPTCVLGWPRRMLRRYTERLSAS